jgi:hypothetical protein
MNVALRKLRDGDAAWLDTWLGACAASVGYDVIDANAANRSLARHVDSSRAMARVIVAGDEDVGVVVFTMRDRGAAIIEFVGVQPSRARRGFGHRGASLAEDELRASGATAIYAPAPAVHGIAVYFWIRLGYRPLQKSDWPCYRDGVAWLRRDVRNYTNGTMPSSQSKASTP